MGKSSKKSGPKVDSAAVVAKPSPKSLKKGRAEQEEAIEKKSASNKKQKVEAKKIIEVIPEKEESSSEVEEEEEEVDSEDDSEVDSEEDVADAEIKTTKADGDSAASKTLYVGNLPYKAEKSDVEEFFQSAGEVVEIRLAIKDGKFRGFGHVEFATEEAAEKALAELNGRDLLDRAVRLEMEKERKSKDAQSVQNGEKSQGQTVFVRGFGKNDSEDQIRKSLEKHFGSCGEITRVAIPKDPMGGVKGIAYIDFKESDACAGALELSGSQLKGETLYVDQAKPRSDSGGGRGGGRGRGRGGRGGGGGRGRGRGGDRGGGRFGGGGGRGRGRRN